MTDRLTRRFSAIEEKKAEVLRRLAALTDEQARAKSGDDWSAAEVAYHLMRAEELLPAPSDGKIARRKPIFFVGCFILRQAISIPSKAKEEPRGDLPLSELSARWSAVREALKARLESARPGERCAEHPVFGALDGAAYLEMLDAHLLYHLKRWPA